MSQLNKNQGEEFQWPFGVLETISMINLLVIAALFYMGITSKDDGKTIYPSAEQKLPIEADIVLQDQQYGLEIARSRWEKSVGLMHRKSPITTTGILYTHVGRPKRKNLWTGNYNFPIDIIVTLNGKVVNIFPNVPPCPPVPNQAPKCPIYMSEPADAYYELPIGAAAKVKIGTLISPKMRSIDQY
jgi:uncharacterized membrane protein (UPF0127 family)